MAEQAALSELRLPPEIAAELKKAVAAQGVTFEEDPKAAEKPTAALPSSPFIVFINGKSGGRLGPSLLASSNELLTPVQVYDLSKAKPNKVVPAIIEALDKLIAETNSEAAKAVRSNLKIMVAGGDGTVGWLLSVVENIEKPPPIAVIPLGTGNDLSRSYGWGPTFSQATTDRVERRLIAGSKAKVCHLDSWILKVTPSSDLDASELKLPYALHKSENAEGPVEFTGNFYNYFSFGMDAQVAYAFHHLRETKPGVARGPRVNKVIYGTYGCTQGWFCASCAPQRHVRCLHMVATVQIQKQEGGPFVDLPLPNGLRAVMVLNLQSYAGGRDPWGKPDKEVEQKNGWTTARPDDGKLEILGLKDGWHSLFMLGGLTGASRLAQAYGVKIELQGENRPAAFLQLDGEPWEQKLSSDGRQPTIVEIIKKPRPALMLADEGAKALEHSGAAVPTPAVAAPAVAAPAAAPAAAPPAPPAEPAVAAPAADAAPVAAAPEIAAS